MMETQIKGYDERHGQKNSISSTTNNSDMNGVYEEGTPTESEEKGNDNPSYQTMCAQPRVQVKHSSSEEDVTFSRQDDSFDENNDVNSYMCAQPKVQSEQHCCTTNNLDIPTEEGSTYTTRQPYQTMCAQPKVIHHLKRM